jgi:hypothetical protein
MAWETEPDAYKAVLPPIFEPVVPYVFCFVGNYPDANFSTPYLEAGLSLPVKYKGELGFYFLAMPLDSPAGGNDDMAIAAGREIYGFPKEAPSKRHLGRGFHHEEPGRVFQGAGGAYRYDHEKDGMEMLAVDPRSEDFHTKLSYNFRHQLNVWNNKFEIASVELTKCYNEIRAYSAEYGQARIQLAYSLDGPWADLVVKRVIGERWCIQDLSMARGMMEPMDVDELYPYVLPRIWDMTYFKQSDHVPWR